MKIKTLKAGKNDKGRRIVLLELDDLDVVLINQMILKFEQEGLVDEDDKKLFADIKEQIHQARRVVRPS